MNHNAGTTLISIYDIEASEEDKLAELSNSTNINIERVDKLVAVFDKASEHVYLQTSTVVVHLNKRCEEYASTKNPATLTKIFNIFEWMGNFLSKDLYIGKIMFKEAFKIGDSPAVRFMLSHLEDLQTRCPKFINFYLENENLFKI